MTKSSMIKLGLVSVALATGFSGCGIKVAPYGVSSSNVEKLRMHETKVNVDTFTATNSETSTMCRLSDPIETPNGETFEKYIENALIEELKMAGVYSKDANITLTGHLEQMSTNTTPGLAYWELSVKVSSSNGKSFTVVSKREFDSSLLAHYACNDMAGAFRPSVEKLLSEIITHDEFKSLIQ